MTEITWLEDDRLGIRPGPNQVPWDLDKIRHAGVTLVVSLTERMLNESQQFAKVGMDHVCIPLPKSAPPKPGDATAIVYLLPAVFDIVNGHLADKHTNRVLIHCSSGKDRSGLFLVYYVMRLRRASPEAALTKVSAIVPSLLSAEGWWDMAVSVLETLDAREGLEKN